MSRFRERTSWGRWLSTTGCAIGLIACNSGGSSELSPVSDQTQTGTETGLIDTGSSQVEPSVPCEPSPATPGSSVTLPFEHDGETRQVTIHLPSDYDCTPRPVVIGLHGYYGSGSGFESSTARMFEHVNTNGYIGVFPDGLPMSNTGWNQYVTSFNDIDSHNSDGPDGATCTADAYDYGVYDNCPPSEGQDACNWGTSCADDEGFLRSLVASLQSQWTIDASRIYLTGFSQGGQTTQSLSWRLADILAASSPHHGFSANGYTVAPGTKMGIIQIWGRSDRTVDGNGVPSSDGMVYDGAQETIDVWAAGQGCMAESVPWPTPYDGIKGWGCEEYPNCSTGASVVSCGWDGGHSWGRDGADAFALESMWTFFQSQQR